MGRFPSLETVGAAGPTCGGPDDVGGPVGGIVGTECPHCGSTALDAAPVGGTFEGIVVGGCPPFGSAPVVGASVGGLSEDSGTST